MAAFREAKRSGIPGIELDIHRCATGEIVVCHDLDLFRVTGEHRIITESSLDAVRNLNAGTSFGHGFNEQVPLLEELFSEFGDSLYYDIEIKHQDTKSNSVETALTGLIQRYGLEHCCMVSSFNPFAIRAFKQLNPRVPTAIIYSRSRSVPLLLRRGQGRYISKCDVMKPSSRCASRYAVFRHTRLSGMPVIPWTVDTVDEARKLIARGVQGIISNDPEPIVRALGRP
jgi:glycerophosphoryl diester phosphodiesterase